MFSSSRYRNTTLRGYRALLSRRGETASDGFLLNLPALSFFLICMIQFGPGHYLDMKSESAERMGMDYLAQWNPKIPAITSGTIRLDIDKH